MGMKKNGGGDNDDDDDDDHNTGGGNIPVAEVMTTSVAASGAGTDGSEPDILYIPSAPQTAKPDINIPSAPGATNSDNQSTTTQDRFDDLQTRFANLKR